MAKAKTIDRLEYTRQRFRRLQSGQEDSQGTPEIQDAAPETESQDSGFIVYPVCSEKLIHESGCLRCYCG